LINIGSINRDVRAWKDPLKFDPERFVGAEGAKIRANGTNLNLLTFSGGRRGCSGFNLAWVLLLRAAAFLIQAFDWSFPPGTPAKDIRAEEDGSHILPKPVHKLRLIAKPRKALYAYQMKF
jgi:cytochrome P450